MKSKLVYISGGDLFTPSEIKSALDEIRENLELPDDVVLFGLPVDELTEQPEEQVIEERPVTEHKVLQFPGIQKKSILNVIKSPETPIVEVEIEEIKISEKPLVVDVLESDIDQSGERSITDLMGEMPSMNEDAPSKKSSLSEEFEDFLAHEEKKPRAHAKKPKPFGSSKRKNPLNLLGDLFSYTGIAANDDAEEFTMPSFIKRP